MNNALKSLENNALAALTQRAPQGVVNAIKTASDKTGVSFSYLMEKAAAESNFNPTVKAKTSSATGLFQFIESTWIDTINRHGAKHGIDTNQSKQDLLNLRKDPEIASVMAAEFAQGNKAYLQKTIGGDIGNTEMYFAHFMGAGGATAFLTQYEKNPLATGADLFPKEANANRGVFYNKNGDARSLGQIYEFFDKKFAGDDAPITMAHKPSDKANSLTNNSERSEGYQHIPFSLKKPIQVIAADNTRSNPAINSLYQIENSINAFFSQPINMFDRANFGFNNGFNNTSNTDPTSLYSRLRTPSSALLDVLR